MAAVVVKISCVTGAMINLCVERDVVKAVTGMPLGMSGASREAGAN